MATAETIPTCPKCHKRTFVRVTLTSDVGRYCLCDHCKVVWHHDDPHQPPPPTDPSPDNDTNA